MELPVVQPLPATIELGGELTQGGWMRGTLPPSTVEATLDGTPFPFAPDGSFFAAFDRDAGTSAKLVARLADGRVIEREIAVSPRKWNIEHINVARTPGGASADFMKIREPELAQIATAREVRSDAEGWRQNFIWPAKGRISGRFGSQRIYRGEPGSYHSGLDISSGTSGTPFVAPADGVVILAAQTPFSLEGHLLMIDHGNGLNSAFLHCSEISVKLGDHVKQGQVIGKIGMSGRATGPHLHWSLKWLDSRLDPLLFLGPMP
ncbi:M23 family metallopeptidase [Erythrobacter sp. SG61-1L]|uniref:M23 family metallopeptidase n=1 Tax=Erythrobacter sp. SG61-1L TaxID=1603897 RepID=UPI001F51D3B5|nr:M23 family metallopeptidase [Erythrobacter sp. SG61-1L]